MAAGVKTSCRIFHHPRWSPLPLPPNSYDTPSPTSKISVATSRLCLIPAQEFTCKIYIHHIHYNTRRTKISKP
jgi:hypothetical protein